MAGEGIAPRGIPNVRQDAGAAHGGRDPHCGWRPHSMGRHCCGLDALLPRSWESPWTSGRRGAE